MTKFVRYHDNIREHNLNHEELVRKFFKENGKTNKGNDILNYKEYKHNYDRAIKRMEKEYQEKIDSIVFIVKNYLERKETEELKEKLRRINMKYKISNLDTGQVLFANNLREYCRSNNMSYNNYQGMIKSIRDKRKYKNIFIELI